MNKKALIVIPARYGSSRFPGKPLVEICGISMIERVWRIAASLNDVRVVVATDDQRIEKLVSSFDGEVVRTDSSCRTGTDRVKQAMDLLQAKEDIIFSFQGDALLTPPWVLEAVIAEFEKNSSIQICTPAVLLKGDVRKDFLASKNAGSSSGTTVVFDKNKDALYFSKSVLPKQREEGGTLADIYRHIGVYAYTRESLSEFASLPEGRLEAAEKLEQLRAIEAGIPIRVVVSDLKERSLLSVDNPEDVAQVEVVIKNEGELVL